MHFYVIVESVNKFAKKAKAEHQRLPNLLSLSSQQTKLDLLQEVEKMFKSISNPNA